MLPSQLLRLWDELQIEGQMLRDKNVWHLNSWFWAFNLLRFTPLHPCPQAFRLNWIISTFLVLQLADSRLWGFSASITLWANSIINIFIALFLLALFPWIFLTNTCLILKCFSKKIDFNIYINIFCQIIKVSLYKVGKIIKREKNFGKKDEEFLIKEKVHCDI